MNGPWKRNVQFAPEMNMTDFRFTEAIFPPRTGEDAQKFPAKSKFLVSVFQ
ncbi:MAG TPA: hypothetical protein VFB43_06765 [Terracidiphilus sp.]|nr:hypothetical protein [Terracidiphilus sp.]